MLKFFYSLLMCVCVCDVNVKCQMCICGKYRFAGKIPIYWIFDKPPIQLCVLTASLNSFECKHCWFYCYALWHEGPAAKSNQMVIKVKIELLFVRRFFFFFFHTNGREKENIRFISTNQTTVRMCNYVLFIKVKFM